MAIVFACREGATLNNAGNCRNFDREWREIDIATITDVSATLDPTIYAPTFLAFFALVSTAYFAGMGIRSILRFIR